METNVAKRNIESTFTAKASNFTIEASAKAFQILSSNLYTDKPMAIVRELSANALDAHRQAKEKRPFSITLPSRMNPSFEIRDYGIGMSPETIMTLYTTFFGSDKNQDNDAIGGLGLGSKTPFSYTDTFTLLSFWEGTKYTWLCMIQEDGQPSIAMVKQAKSKEARGIQYIIPIKQEDFYTFANKAKTVLKYFPAGSYEANDIQVTPVSYGLRRDEYGIRDENAAFPRVIMGPIAYRIDKGALNEKTQKQFNSLLSNGRLDIFCSIGDIDIQASREALSYDKRSQKQISAVLERVADRITTDTTEEIKSCETYLEACGKGVALSSQTDAKFDQLSWRGAKLQRNFDFNSNIAACVVSGHNSLTKSDALSVSFRAYDSVTIDTAAEAVILLYDPTVQHNKLRLKTRLLLDRSQKYIVFSNEQDMFSFQHATQRMDNISTEDLPMPEKSDTTYRSISRTKVQLKLRTNGQTWKNLSSSLDEINKMEGTCWVALNGGGSEPWECSEDRKAYDLINRFQTINVVGIPKSLKRKAKYLTLPTLQEHVRGLIIEILASEERYTAAFVCRSNISWLADFCIHVDAKKWAKLDIVKEAELHVATTKLFRATDTLRTLFGWKLKARTNKQIEASDNKLKKLYPLMEIINNMYGVQLTKNFFVNELLSLIHRRK